MISFSIPIKSGGSSDFFDFTVDSHCVSFAGSRFLSVDQQTAKDLVNIFGSIGFSFLTGCANGVDSSFRSALAGSAYKERAIVALAFPDRACRCFDLNSFVVSDGHPPRAALAKRTVWMCCRSSLLVLFPSTPIGKGSALAFRTAIKNNKPVFVVSETPPEESESYMILPSGLFGIAQGYWCIPEALKKTGLSNEMRYRRTAIA